MHTDGIAMVQNITRPLGIPIQHSSIPFQTSMQGQTTNQNLPFLKDRTGRHPQMADQMQCHRSTPWRRCTTSPSSSPQPPKTWPAKTHDLVATTNELRDHIADFDDFFRPIRNYFYWEPHCFDIPICWSLRSIFDSLDGIDATADKIGALQVDIDKLASLTPQAGRTHTADHRHHEDHARR